MIWQYIHIHYQDNFLAGLLDSLFLGGLVFLGAFVCAEKLCFRPGWHQIKGTHKRTCNKHATKSIHEKHQHKHFAKYPQQHKFLKEK